MVSRCLPLYYLARLWIFPPRHWEGLRRPWETSWCREPPACSCWSWRCSWRRRCPHLSVLTFSSPAAPESARQRWARPQLLPRYRRICGEQAHSPALLQAADWGIWPGDLGLPALGTSYRTRTDLAASSPVQPSWCPWIWWQPRSPGPPSEFSTAGSPSQTTPSWCRAHPALLFRTNFLGFYSCSQDQRILSDRSTACQELWWLSRRYTCRGCRSVCPRYTRCGTDRHRRRTEVYTDTAWKIIISSSEPIWTNQDCSHPLWAWPRPLQVWRNFSSRGRMSTSEQDQNWYFFPHSAACLTSLMEQSIHFRSDGSRTS